jgi:hypothetical protein
VAPLWVRVLALALALAGLLGSEVVSEAVAAAGGCEFLNAEVVVKVAVQPALAEGRGSAVAAKASV